MKLSPTQIQEIAEREEKATPGPWVPAEDPRPGMIYNVHVESPAGTVCFPAHGELDEDGDDDGFATGNMAFVAHSRQDIPNLLAHIAAQDEEARRFYRADGTFETLATAREVVAKRKEAAAKIAKLERERDEQRHLIQEIAAENMRIFIALGGHPDEPRSDMELLDDLFNQFRRAESDRAESRARIAQLESQIAVKDAALKWDIEHCLQCCGTGEEAHREVLGSIPFDCLYCAKAREALKASAK